MNYHKARRHKCNDGTEVEARRELSVRRHWQTCEETRLPSSPQIFRRRIAPRMAGRGQVILAWPKFTKTRNNQGQDHAFSHGPVEHTVCLSHCSIANSQNVIIEPPPRNPAEWSRSASVPQPAAVLSSRCAQRALVAPG